MDMTDAFTREHLVAPLFWGSLSVYLKYSGIVKAYMTHESGLMIEYFHPLFYIMTGLTLANRNAPNV